MTETILRKLSDKISEVYDLKGYGNIFLFWLIDKNL